MMLTKDKHLTPDLSQQMISMFKWSQPFPIQLCKHYVIADFQKDSKSPKLWSRLWTGVNFRFHQMDLGWIGNIWHPQPPPVKKTVKRDPLTEEIQQKIVQTGVYMYLHWLCRVLQALTSTHLPPPPHMDGTCSYPHPTETLKKASIG